MIKLELEAETFEALREKACATLGIVIGAVEVAAPKAVKPKETKPVPQSDAPVLKQEHTHIEPEQIQTNTGDASSVAELQSSQGTLDGELDYQRDVKPAVLKISQKLGRPGVETLLKPFGVTNAQQIPAARWPELMTAVAELMEA